MGVNKGCVDPYISKAVVVEVADRTRSASNHRSIGPGCGLAAEFEHLVQLH